MPSLNYFLENINNSCDAIQDLGFQPPGMFTNSIITKPDITQLLKDANESESLLYKVKHKSAAYGHIEDPTDTMLERVDGKSYFVDNALDEYSNGGVDQGFKRTAVSVPQLATEHNGTGRTGGLGSSSDTGSSPSKSKSYMDVSEDHPTTYRSIIETINKLPVSDEEYVQSIRDMKREYDELTADISELQRVYDENQKTLHSHNIYGMDIDEANIDRALRREEEQVAELERQIEAKKAKLAV